MSEETTYVYDEPEGRVWVQVLSAVDDSGRRLDGTPVSYRHPALRVTTYRDGVSVTGNRSFVTLRGRRYSFDEVYSREVYQTTSRWGGNHRTQSGRGLETEGGEALDWRSPTRLKLRAIETRVRDRFVADHPEWQRISVRLRLAELIRQAEDKAVNLRMQADVQQVAAEKFRAELDAL
jgi:hypothetical protein